MRATNVQEGKWTGFVYRHCVRGGLAPFARFGGGALGVVGLAEGVTRGIATLRQSKDVGEIHDAAITLYRSPRPRAHDALGLLGPFISAKLEEFKPALQHRGEELRKTEVAFMRREMEIADLRSTKRAQTMDAQELGEAMRLLTKGSGVAIGEIEAQKKEHEAVAAKAEASIREKDEEYRVISKVLEEIHAQQAQQLGFKYYDENSPLAKLATLMLIHTAPAHPTHDLVGSCSPSDRSYIVESIGNAVRSDLEPSKLFAQIRKIWGAGPRNDNLFKLLARLTHLMGNDVEGINLVFDLAINNTNSVLQRILAEPIEIATEKLTAKGYLGNKATQKIRSLLAAQKALGEARPLETLIYALLNIE